MPHILTARNGKVESVHYPNKTTHEWWVEDLDVRPDINSQGVNMGTVDIIDCYAASKEGALAASNEPNQRGCLRRLLGNDADGVLEIGYAYIIDGVLDTNFCSGHKVPARFLKQVNGDAK